MNLNFNYYYYLKMILSNDFILVRILYLRLYALIYLLAFLQIFNQIHELWSFHGILP